MTLYVDIAIAVGIVVTCLVVFDRWCALARASTKKVYEHPVLRQDVIFWRGILLWTHVAFAAGLVYGGLLLWRAWVHA